MAVAEEVAKILLDVKAVSIDTAKPYKYASGIYSPLFTDCRTVISFPEKRKMIIQDLAAALKKVRPGVNMLIGAGNSGIPFAAYLADELKLPMAFARAKAKDHGKGNQLEGDLTQGSKAAVIADIISTEPVVLETVRAAKASGISVDCVLSVFSNNLNGIEAELEREGVDVLSLSDLKTLLKLASARGYVSQPELRAINDWSSDPQFWEEKRQSRLAAEREQAGRRVAEALLDIKAVTLSPARPYKWSSGILAPIYTDNRLFMSYPEKWQLVIDGMARVITEEIGLRNVDAIAGVASGGIPHAAKLSDQLGLPMLYIKAGADEYGRRRIIEGDFSAGDRLVILEDLISTGGSSLRAIKAVRDLGGKVSDCVAIFTYQFAEAAKAFENDKVRLHTLTDFKTLVDVARQRGSITAEEAAVVGEWSGDPKGWGAKQGFEQAAVV